MQMNFVTFDNPGQAIIVSIFTFAAVSLLNALPISWFGNIPYLAFLLFAVSFIVIIGLVIRTGHYVDFVFSQESRMRGLFCEVYHVNDDPRIAIYSVTYSASTRKFAINGIAFQRSVDGKTLFSPHGIWNSTGVSLRYVDSRVSGIFYSYKGQRFEAEGQQSQPGYTWIAVSAATESPGYFSDIDGPVHKRILLRSYRIRESKRRYSFLSRFYDFDSRHLRRFTSNEYAGAELLQSIYRTLTASATGEERGQASTATRGSVEAEGIIFPAGLVKWLRIEIPDLEKGKQLTTTDERITELIRLSRNAYARYSNFPVTSCVVTSSGTHFFGTNYENAAYPQGLCSEAVAIGAMVTAGERRISEIFLYAPKNFDVIPCGGCLQKLIEFSGPHTSVHSVRDDHTMKSRPLHTLLPIQFELLK
jgi:cytidine deaminase